MTFLAPGFLIASLAAASAVVVLHFIVTRQPRAGILPTARFVPDMPATATARARRPSDILLMLLRVLILLAAGAGLARPVIKPSRGAEARVILADVSRAVGNVAELRDSVRAVFREGDAIVAFDSAARPITGNVADSIGALNRNSQIVPPVKSIPSFKPPRSRKTSPGTMIRPEKRKNHLRLPTISNTTPPGVGTED